MPVCLCFLFLYVFNIFSVIVLSVVCLSALFHGPRCLKLKLMIMMMLFLAPKQQRQSTEGNNHVTLQKSHHIVSAPVGVVRKPVVKDPVDLVYPQTDQLVGLSHAVGGHKQHAAHDARKVAQVEDVVRLARRRQELRHRRLVDAHRRADHHLRRQVRVSGRRGAARICCAVL